jgi:DNA-directed RNA polymerase III subunit RPC1
VPEKVAVKLSYPERVNDYNMERMRDAVINGAALHPGANLIHTKLYDGSLWIRSLAFMKEREARVQLARNLKIGDIVHRHVRDGE